MSQILRSILPPTVPNVLTTDSGGAGTGTERVTAFLAAVTLVLTLVLASYCTNYCRFAGFTDIGFLGFHASFDAALTRFDART
jgi:hypothetical protein